MREGAEGWRWLLPQVATRRGTLVATAYYMLSLLPAMVTGGTAAVRSYWLASSFALATGVLWLHARSGVARVGAYGINAVATLGNLLLAVSLAIQGTGFNAQFFYHVDLGTLFVVKTAYAPFAVAAVAYWLLVSMWLGLLQQTPIAARTPSGRATALLLVVAIALNAAVVSAIWHVGAEFVRSQRVVLVPKVHRTATAARAREAGRKGEARNLVIVVAESMEATYARSDLFGADLTPVLTSLEADATLFTDMRQVSHTGWTSGALVAASCGVPAGPISRFKQRKSDPSMRTLGAVCLGDVLAAHGYRTVFMGGAPLSFGGKGAFLAAHGFAERHGFHTLSSHLADPSYISNWGLYDDSLLALARDKLGELAAGDAPFALMVLTLDTHFPPGHPSASCGAQDDLDDRAFIIRCADRLVASFVEDARAMAPDAVVALYSDHLSQESPRRAGLLASEAAMDARDETTSIWGLVDVPRDHGSRRLRFAIWDPTRPAKIVDRPGTHFDIMPTVLDFLGIEGWSPHGFGRSLLRGSSPWLGHPNPDGLQVVYELPSLHLPPNGEVAFDARGPTIELDGERLFATDRGLTFEDAVFAVAFAEDGTASRILDADAFDGMLDLGRGPAPVVVGVSSQRDVNQRLVAGTTSPLAFFAGRPNTAGFVTGPLPRSQDHSTIRIVLPSQSLGRRRPMRRLVAVPWTAARRGAAIAAFYLLCILPAVFAGHHSGMHGYWLASSLALATGVLWLCQRGGVARVAAFTLNAVTALGNLFLVVSLLIQGTGFNAQFFYHMELETLFAVKEAYRQLAVTAAVYWLLVCMWVALLPAVPHNAPNRSTTAAVLVAAVALNAAFLSLVSHVGTELVRSLRIVLVPKPHRTVTAPAGEAGAREARNLVIVVAESLEATYARSDLFGADLTPALTSLEADAVLLTDMQQVSHTGWTMGAVVAASCGLPLMPQHWWDQRMLDVDARMLGAVCLGDVLAAHGYRAVVMIGHRLAFADTSGFFASHGFAEQHGLTSLREHLADPSYLSDWGLYDDSLLALARDRLRELVAGDAPFALMVLTMDTHFPPGHPSASCGTPTDPDDRAFVIRCADRLLASFVEDARAMAPDAVVALYSDHLSREHPHRAGLLTPGAAADTLAGGTKVLGFFGGTETHGSRRLRFAVWDRTRPCRDCGSPRHTLRCHADHSGFRWHRGLGGARLRRVAAPRLEPVACLPKAGCLADRA